MTRETFNLQFAALLNAYAYAVERVSPESEGVYWEMLKGIPDAEFIAGVRTCLASSKFFPTIADLGAASLPAFLEPAAYNPRIYTEPRKVDWQEQVRRLETREQNKAIDGRVKTLVRQVLK